MPLRRINVCADRGRKGGCWIGSPPQFRERRIKAIAFKAVGLFKKRKLASCIPATCPPSQRGDGAQGRVTEMTPPRDEGKTHPWSPSFPRCMEGGSCPLLQFLELGAHMEFGVWGCGLDVTLIGVR